MDETFCRNPLQVVILRLANLPIDLLQLYLFQNCWQIYWQYECLLIFSHSFWTFRGLTYGMSGPMAHLPEATAAVYKWMDSWEV